MVVVIVKVDSLLWLANTYFHYLLDRNGTAIKSVLSMDFVKRLRVSEQLKLIRDLPITIYGVDREVALFHDYVAVEGNGVMRIEPFQFDVLYYPQHNPVAAEKTTITIQSVILEDEWVIESIVTESDAMLLRKLARSHRERQPVTMPG